MLKLGTKKIGKLIFVRFATEESESSACHSERKRGNQGEAAFRYAGLPRRNFVASRNDKWKIDFKFSACVRSIVPLAQYYAHSKSNLSATRAINSPLVGFSLGA